MAAEADRGVSVSDVDVSVGGNGDQTVSICHYNILASYLGLNKQPWFLYGALGPRHNTHTHHLIMHVLFDRQMGVVLSYSACSSLDALCR